MADVFGELVEHWHRQGSIVSTVKATPEEIGKWQAKFGVHLPSDLREYFVRANGMLDGDKLDFGHDLTSFLPMSAVVPGNQWDERYDQPDLFVIADYLISSHWWCVHLTKQPSEHSRVYVCGGERPKLVASSLTEFLRSYMSGSLGIHP